MKAHNRPAMVLAQGSPHKDKGQRMQSDNLEDHVDMLATLQSVQLVPVASDKTTWVRQF
jgi:hypothetical protein